jgi:hypothetical protein
MRCLTTARGRGTKLGVRNRSGKKSRPEDRPALIAGAIRWSKRCRAYRPTCLPSMSRRADPRASRDDAALLRETGAERMQGQGRRRSQQHEVLHDVLALHAEPQRVAVHEGHVGPQHSTRNMPDSSRAAAPRKIGIRRPIKSPAPSATSNAPTSGTDRSGSTNGVMRRSTTPATLAHRRA